MRVAITGATGNVGTSLLHALAGEERVESIVGVARRRPSMEWPKTTWVEADVSRDDLEPHFRGADCVVHLAWLIQPSRDEATLYATNVEGSRRVFDATARAGVPALVYASSVGAYSPGPKDRAVDESWPTNGIATSFYSRHKAATERLLDSFEREHPELRVVRYRPGLIFKREAGTEIRRLFAGPFLPSPLVRPSLVPVVPKVERLRFQAVHSLDIGDAYRLAIVRDDARGAYNVAADPVLDPDVLARLLHARQVPVSPRVLRTVADLAWRLRLQPTPKGWVDMALGVPIMSTERIRSQLGWNPRRTSCDALLDLLAGMREGSGVDTPPLAPQTSGRFRARELLTGIGQRNP
ncbi:MAG: UDP-glucose 4-epimerase [Thermoleophilales bacterium]|nr:UDP-glucose 4-epimerase [Thermoleophilales bacterium]